MLVTDIVNVGYLTGFGGTNGACVCGADTRLFLTDFRYTERAEAEVEGWEVITVQRRLAGRDRRAPLRAGRLRGRPRLGPTARAAARRNSPDGVELDGRRAATVEKLRRVKDDAELAAIAAASELADEVWRWSLERGLVGRSEREVARAAEARIRELGGEPSFPAIVAAGPNGALPHAEPGEREIGERRAGRLRHGREARRLLLRRHPHLRHRRAGRAGARGLRDGARGPGGGAGGGRGGGRRRAARRRRPRVDRRGRPRRALRPRPRPRGRARGARGAARLAALRGRARAPAKW